MKPALLIIDMQKRWFNFDKRIYPDKTIGISNIKKIVEEFHRKKYPVIYVKMVHKSDGSTLMFDTKNVWMVEGTEETEVIEELKPKQKDYVVFKTRYSAFVRTNLLELLKELEVNELIITGYQLAACVNTTMMDAYQYDFKHYVISDACFGNSKRELARYLPMYKKVNSSKTTKEILKMLKDKTLKSLCQDCMKE